LWTAFVAASFITLGVVGLSMIYNILNFPTFAQGDHIATGAYLALGLVALMGTAGSIAGLSFGWPLILALIGAVCSTGSWRWRWTRRSSAQLRRQNASRISLIMASFGVALMLRHLIVVFAGHEPQYFSFAIQPALDFWRRADHAQRTGVRSRHHGHGHRPAPVPVAHLAGQVDARGVGEPGRWPR
jgi:branched-chain amino acid transport system permease protein